jgi:hypothetical protein
VRIAVEVLTVLLAAVTMSLALAHALELPGKLRLSKDQYLAVQAIYYPGFTLGGIAELASIIAALALLTLTPWGSVQSWLIAGALAALAAVQVIFWLMTQPANNIGCRLRNSRTWPLASSGPAARRQQGIGLRCATDGSARTSFAPLPPSTLSSF